MKKLVVCLAVFTLAMSAMFAGAAFAAEKPYNIALIIKATDSDFWQYVIVGGTNYGLEFPEVAKVTNYGPPSEADIDKQVAIVEDVIASKPDAIVIASTSSDATVPALERAVDEGIVVITIDNKVNTDKVHSFLATNNTVGGALAADKMVEAMNAAGIPLKGKVAIVSAMAGIQVLDDRDAGFTEQMKKIAPEIEIIPPRYVDNDIIKALGVAEDLITANDDLIGIFADNNHTGDGVSRAIAEQKLEGKIMVTAFDSDPEEIKALESGAIKALILQDPYGMGYKGCDFAVQVLDGKEVPKYVDTGAVAVTKENMNDEEIKGLLDPMLKKKQ
ncbi:periplasmic binding protein/LacI transcriptional regulator [Candidatus Vecturithrix granuli]|uniref:Periplasmic binding protein/LacI transcriptional regulator n=1 Tax=Vecturithrix granuli TaxID=1499967 RepID=A0A081C2Z6_VECG1|nr:periplasmic binding protein/LacI transcriptional regulator [Candidatus Vecturithrix granuli]